MKEAIMKLQTYKLFEDGELLVCRNDVLKALEQEPCEDAKTGHWIESAEEYYKAVNEYGGGANENTEYFTDDIACPKCLSKFSVIDNETERFKYCPNCGAKMESEVEQ